MSGSLTGFRSVLKIGDMTGLLLDDDLTGKPFADPHLWTRGRRDIETDTGQIGKALQVRMIEPDIHRIDVEMTEGLIHQNVQGQAQVKGGGDGGVNIAQGCQSANLSLALIVKLGTMDRIAGDLRQDRQKIDLLGDLSPLFNFDR